MLIPFSFEYYVYLRLFNIGIVILVVTDPLGDVRRFVEQFNEWYGANHPEFYDGTYSQVITTFCIINFILICSVISMLEYLAF